MSPDFWLTLKYLLPLAAIAIIARHPRFQNLFEASFETTDYAATKREISAECSTEFSKAEDLLKNPTVLTPGDLIQFPRYWGAYDHWGVYVGGGRGSRLYFMNQLFYRINYLCLLSKVWIFCYFR